MARYMVIDIDSNLGEVVIVDDAPTEEAALREAKVRMSELSERNYLSVGDVEAATFFLVEVKGIYYPETTHSYDLSGGPI